MHIASKNRMRALHVPVAVVTGALALAACEHTYLYEPAVSTTSATVAGRPASYYTIPPESPRGHIRIATMGLAEIQPTEENGPEVHALHLRMVVANNSDKAWTVDTREQRAILPRGGESRPAYAIVDHGSPPQVAVPPLAERTFDLFYPLPHNMQKESALPSFDVLWTVDTDARRVVERTPFERIEIAPEPYPDYYTYGQPYWYDPYYFRGGSFVGVGVSPAYFEHPIVIHRYPR
jgi:hypothetical protein